MGDASEQAKGPILQDLLFDVYRDLINTRAGSPSFVINVENFSTNQPETIDDSGVVVRAQFNIKYRVQF
jgi:hypothetical protein